MPPPEEHMNDAEKAALEAHGWLYCRTCGGWYDDTYCWPGDHSQHCGHRLMPAGDAYAPDSIMVLVCESATAVPTTPAGRGR